MQNSRKKILISLICLVSLMLLSSNANAVTYVVHEPTSSECTQGDASYETLQGAIDAVPWGSIDDTIIIVCPGTYNENILVNKCNLTIRSKTQNPSDTVVQAGNAGENVFTINTWHDCHTFANVTISGFKITGATEGPEGGCYNGSNYDSDRPQPCAGIRVYCTIGGTITHNYVTRE